MVLIFIIFYFVVYLNNILDYIGVTDEPGAVNLL